MVVKKTRLERAEDFFFDMATIGVVCCGVIVAMVKKWRNSDENSEQN